MRCFRRTAAVLMLGLLIVPVGMACTLPEVEMTSAEKQCCRRMAHDCAAIAGKSSHSCCRTEVRRDNNYISAHSANLERATHAITLVVPIDLDAHFESANQVALAVAHAPPEVTSLTTVLRI